MNLKIIGVFFHLITLLILIITLNLLLDFRFRGNNLMEADFNSDNGISSILVFIILSLIMGVLSVSLLIFKWFNENKLELYLKSFLITDIILILGTSFLIFI